MAQPTIQDAFSLAMQHHQSGRLQAAEELYRQVLARDSAHAGAMQFMGVLAHQHGKNDIALDLIRRSLALNPNIPDAHNNLGIVLFALGEIDQAIVCYQAALSLNPKFPSALFNLGDALHRRGRLDEAIAAFGQAIASQPTHAHAYNNLGIALRDKQQLDDAIAAFRKAIAFNPALGEAHTNLGNSLKTKGQFDESIIAHRQAIALNPGFAEAHHNLANALFASGQYDHAIAAYQKAIALRNNFAEAHSSLGDLFRSQGRFDDAIAAHRRAIQANPNFVAAHVGIALVLRDMGRLEEAVNCLREAQRIDPNSKQIAFELAALNGDNSAPSAPPTLVRALFDQYAHRFDEHLVKTLEYHAPEQLQAAIQSLTQRTNLDVLDLGCGTGLCGVELRPMARKLVGVDLSPGMLQRCARKNIYEELIEGDVTKVLLQTPAQWDLIVASDVLIYVGDLTAFLPAAAAALRPGGWLAFTIERFEGEGFFLHNSFRFAHSVNYVREIANQAHLIEVFNQNITLRLQLTTPVPGSIIVLSKPQP